MSRSPRFASAWAVLDRLGARLRTESLSPADVFPWRRSSARSNRIPVVNCTGIGGATWAPNRLTRGDGELLSLVVSNETDQSFSSNDILFSDKKVTFNGTSSRNEP